jgi:hypothetical protein
MPIDCQLLFWLQVIGIGCQLLVLVSNYWNRFFIIFSKNRWFIVVIQGFSQGVYGVEALHRDAQKLDV